MKHLLCLCALATLTACLPLSTYYKEGASVAQLERDKTACDVRALRQAPVATQIRVGPPRYVPRRRHCDARGNCVYRGGFFVDGETYTVDTNAELRARITRLCMADEGYRPVEIPPCPSNIADRAPQGPTTILPRLTPQSCVIRRQGQGVRIVTRR